MQNSLETHEWLSHLYTGAYSYPPSHPHPFPYLLGGLGVEFLPMATENCHVLLKPGLENFKHYFTSM